MLKNVYVIEKYNNSKSKMAPIEQKLKSPNYGKKVFHLEKKNQTCLKNHSWYRRCWPNFTFKVRKASLVSMSGVIRLAKNFLDVLMFKSCGKPKKSKAFKNKVSHFYSLLPNFWMLFMIIFSINIKIKFVKTNHWPKYIWNIYIYLQKRTFEWEWMLNAKFNQSVYLWIAVKVFEVDEVCPSITL